MAMGPRDAKGKDSQLAEPLPLAEAVSFFDSMEPHDKLIRDMDAQHGWVRGKSQDPTTKMKVASGKHTKSY